MDRPDRYFVHPPGEPFTLVGKDSGDKDATDSAPAWSKDSSTASRARLAEMSLHPGAAGSGIRPDDSASGDMGSPVGWAWIESPCVAGRPPRLHRQERAGGDSDSRPPYGRLPSQEKLPPVQSRAHREIAPGPLQLAPRRSSPVAQAGPESWSHPQRMPLAGGPGSIRKGPVAGSRHSCRTHGPRLLGWRQARRAWPWAFSIS